MDAKDVAGLILPGSADVEAVRRAARRARNLAEQISDGASRARSTLAVDWRSLAAEQFRDGLASCSAQVDACAQRLDDAAVALARHASTTEARLAAARAVVGDPP